MPDLTGAAVRLLGPLHLFADRVQHLHLLPDLGEPLLEVDLGWRSGPGITFGAIELDCVKLDASFELLDPGL